jgi:alkanesulfonate monooxygenase SsuD/methylene tetrahydromethanopterin reductase-like flavin-dependent oxidoreductase (luciferase family)
MIVGIELSGGPAEAASHFGWMRAAAAAARSAGFELIAPPSQRWLGEPERLQPMQTMAALAAEADPMALSTGRLLAAALNPVDLSEQIITLDHASGGRTLVEVRLTAAPGELTPFGVADEEAAGRAIEAIGLWRRLWSEDVVDHEGRFYHVSGARPTLRPYRGAAPPIAVAVSEPAHVQLAVDHGVGLSIDAAVTTISVAKDWVALLRSEIGGDVPVVFRIDAVNASQVKAHIDQLSDVGCSHAIVRARAATQSWTTMVQECHVVLDRRVGDTRR